MTDKPIEAKVTEEDIRKAEGIYIDWNTNDDQFRFECRKRIAKALAEERIKTLRSKVVTDLVNELAWLHDYKILSNYGIEALENYTKAVGE